MNVGLAAVGESGAGATLPTCEALPTYEETLPTYEETLSVTGKS